MLSATIFLSIFEFRICIPTKYISNTKIILSCYFARTTISKNLRIGKDSCNGDSGGPLIQRAYVGTPWFQVGVVSFGTSICGTGTPGTVAELNDKCALPIFKVIKREVVTIFHK